MHQGTPFSVKRLAEPVWILRPRLVAVVKRQVPLELYAGIVVSSSSSVIFITLGCLEPRVGHLQDLGAVRVYLVPHDIRRLQTDLGPVRGQCPRMR